jgi:hypothetical protein
LNEPTAREEYFEIIRRMGHKLTTLTFMKNPKWMDKIPDSPDAEDYDTLYMRAQYDERITFPVDNLPTELRKHFTKGKGGSQYAVALVYYRCNCMVDVPAPGYGEQVENADGTWGRKNKEWLKLECGLVHAAVTGFEYSCHSGSGAKHRYKCKSCAMKWLLAKPGSRFLVIYDGETVIQIILNEPPPPLLESHLIDRAKYYKKFEPRAGLRDAIPIIPQREASVRIRATDEDLSNQIWQSVLGSQDCFEATEVIDRVTKAAMKDVNQPTHAICLDTGAAMRHNPDACTEAGVEGSGDFVMLESLL